MFNTLAFDTKQFDTAQLENFFAPARAFAELSVDVTEKLVNVQLEAAQAYADINLTQLRSLTEVKDAEGLKGYMEGQQQAFQDLTERFKGDAEKVVALQQEFAQESQKLTESGVKQVQESAKEVQESAKQSVEDLQESAKASAKETQDSGAKSAKEASSKAK